MDKQLLGELLNAGYQFEPNPNEQGSYKEPTLEEIIEACGEKFHLLERDYKTYSDTSKGKGGLAGQMFTEEAVGWVATKRYDEVIARGKTPIEAVARLYIALKGIK